MDTQAPTKFEKADSSSREENGALAPLSTPVDSDSCRSVHRQSRQERLGAGYRVHSQSPLHASSRSSSAPRRTLSLSRSGTPDPTHDAGESAGTGEVEEKRRAPPGFKRSSFSRRNSNKGTTEVQKKPSKSWMTNLRRSRYRPSLVLKNSGSVARDHLASERTFLAYVRTSMGLASMGVGEYACLSYREALLS